MMLLDDHSEASLSPVGPCYHRNGRRRLPRRCNHPRISGCCSRCEGRLCEPESLQGHIAWHTDFDVRPPWCVLAHPDLLLSLTQERSQPLRQEVGQSYRGQLPQQNRKIHFVEGFGKVNHYIKMCATKMTLHGQQKYAKFVEECINTNEVSVWARMKQVQQKMWKSARTSVKHKLAQVVELKDDRSLFARKIIIARSRPRIDLKEAMVWPARVYLPPMRIVLCEWGISTMYRQKQPDGYTWGADQQYRWWSAVRGCHQWCCSTATKEGEYPWWNGSCPGNG